MLTLVLRRVALALPSLAGVVVVTFVLTRALPGDPAAYFAGPAATPQAIAEIRHHLGLDRSVPAQFLAYLRDLARGDLGTSLTTGQPVGAELAARLPASAELTLLGLLIACAVGIPLGVMAALHRGRGWDALCRLVATGGVCLPVFFTGLLLIYVFYYLLGWAPPPLGRLDAYDTPPDTVTGFYLVDSLLAGDLRLFLACLKPLVLPALALGLFSTAPLARMTRAAMLGVLSSDWVRTARRGPRARHGRGHLRFPQRGAAGRDHARHGVQLLAGRERARREGVLLARGRIVRGRGPARLGLRAGPGLRARDGGALHWAEPRHRPALRLARPPHPDRGVSAAQAAPPMGLALQARRALRADPVTTAAAALLAALTLVALLGPALAPYGAYATDAAAALQPPSRAHPFGTDQLGRDLLSRVLVAARLDLGIAGVAAGYLGGWVDRVVGRVADTVMAFPLFVLAMGIVAALGNSVGNIVLATAVVNWPLYVRVARAEAARTREAGFIEAARLGGEGELRILATRVAPLALPVLVVQASLTMGYAILNAAGLSFIGLGVRPPTAEWGIMVADGAQVIVSGQWWVALFPGLALMLAVLCFNLLGDALRDLADPRTRA
jgi:peptide/nickel transport system permease protein